MMRWITNGCGAAALAWTAVSFAGYSDWGLAFRISLVGWFIYAVVWVAGRLNFTAQVKTAEPPRKPTALNRHRLAIAGAAAAVLVLAVLTVQWLGKMNQGANEDSAVALKSETEPPPTKQEPPAEAEPKPERAVAHE